MSIKIKPVPKITLSDHVASNLAVSIIRGDFPANAQLPTERELVTQLDVSRSTLREALKVLADNHLIEAKPGVGLFVSWTTITSPKRMPWQAGSLRKCPFRNRWSA